jgi:uncharacterized protein (DUF488 family)
MTQETALIYSVGHSNHEIGHFLALLSRQRIQAVVDVRSSPWSRFSPQFNRQALEHSLASNGMHYVFLGRELGGRPEDDLFYDEQGHVLYSKVAATPLFESGMRRLVDDGREQTIAMMCSEEDPTECHRRLLITRVLVERGVRVKHIRGDGLVQPEENFAPTGLQQTLFAEEVPWRSTRSVLHRRPRVTSSAD